MDRDDVPRYWQLINPIFDSLKELGGSGTNSEILDKVMELAGYPPEMADVVHDDVRRQSEIAYQMSWAESYMKLYGIISSSRGVWTLTRSYINKNTCPDGQDIVNNVNKRNRPQNASSAAEAETKRPGDRPELSIADWPDTERNAFVKKRLSELLMDMSPHGFGQFSQRLLRELGFERVNVTQQYNDGGIDGTGVYRVNRVLSMKVAFQCRRCQGTVGAEEVSDFRSVLTSDVEHGLVITTGTFSRAAVEEARCPGKQLIDLIDGPTFVDLIFELGLGVRQNQGWTNMTYMVDERLFAAYTTQPDDPTPGA